MCCSITRARTWRQDRSPRLCGPAAVQCRRAGDWRHFVLFRQALTDPDFVTSTLQILRPGPRQRSSASGRCPHPPPGVAAGQGAGRHPGARPGAPHHLLEQSAERLYGWTSCRRWANPCRPAVRRPRAVLRATEATLEHGEWTGELVQRHRDGRTIDVEGRWTLVRGEDGSPSPSWPSTPTSPSARPPSVKSSAWPLRPADQPAQPHAADGSHAHALAAAQRHQQGGALLFIDLDNFKTSTTPWATTRAICCCSKWPSGWACVRSVDTVARLGGDEFVVMLEELSASGDDLVLQARSVGEKS